MLSKAKTKYIQTLGQKKQRDKEGVFIAEGPKIVDELLTSARSQLLEVYALKEWIDQHDRTQGLNSIEVSEDELAEISQLMQPNKVLAIVKQFPHSTSITIKGRIVLALDTIQDPGNMGTLLRTADWFGIHNIVCSPDSADIYNPKVVQSSMGSVARVNCIYMDLVKWLSTQKNVGIYATTLDGQDIRSMKKITEGILVIGNESKGIQPAILELANVKVSIPGKGKAESLNAAVAAGIVMAYLC